MSHPTFRSMEEMEQYFYGGDIIQKAVLTTGESGVYNRVSRSGDQQISDTYVERKLRSW